MELQVRPEDFAVRGGRESALRRAMGFRTWAGSDFGRGFFFLFCKKFREGGGLFSRENCAVAGLEV